MKNSNFSSSFNNTHNLLSSPSAMKEPVSGLIPSLMPFEVDEDHFICGSSVYDGGNENVVTTPSSHDQIHKYNKCSQAADLLMAKVYSQQTAATDATPSNHYSDSVSSEDETPTRQAAIEL